MVYLKRLTMGPPMLDPVLEREWRPVCGRWPLCGRRRAASGERSANLPAQPGMPALWLSAAVSSAPCLRLPSPRPLCFLSAGNFNKNFAKPIEKGKKTRYNRKEMDESGLFCGKSKYEAITMSSRIFLYVVLQMKDSTESHRRDRLRNGGLQ